MWTRFKLHSKVRAIALLVGVIVVGSICSDLDHILPPFKGAWGHSEIILLVAFLLGLGIAYLGRQIKSRILRSKE